MMCISCRRHIDPAPTVLPNGSAWYHTDTTFRLCNPTDPISPWAAPAPEPKEPA